MSRTTRFILLITVAIGASPAMAITAEDVLEKMSKDQQFGYLTGLIDMLAYKELLEGDKPYAQCLSDAFYKDKTMSERIFSSLRAYPDKAPEGIIYLLMMKACGR